MKADQNTDEILVNAFKAGDHIALATLVKRWHKLFCEKAYWLVRDKDIAKDIAQDSWTIIIEKIDKLKEPKLFKYWAFRIVCNKSTDWLREQTRKKRNKVEYEIVTKNNSIETPGNNNLKQLMLKEIEELPDGQKKVIRLFYMEAYSLKQISEILDISIGTTKSRLFHAREKLKKSLKHRNYEN